MDLKEWLFRNDLNISQFAKKTGLCRLTISKIIKNQIVPRKGTVYIIKDFTNGEVSEDDLPKAPPKKNYILCDECKKRVYDEKNV